MKPGALPLYLQTSEGLIRDIAAGHLADGQRLPPERQMAATLGIAVGTLRQALDDLTAKGLLIRKHGSGNYIRAAANPDSIYAFFRLELHAGGGLPTAQVLSVDRLTKDPGLPPFGTHAEAHRIRRLRLLSGTAAAIEEIWLDAAHADTLVANDLSDSLYLHYRHALNLIISRVEDRVGQGALPDWSPAAFPQAPGTRLPEISRRAQTADNITAEVSRTWFDPATTAYVSRLR